ncbi:autoinducer binding domain-containing protein [Palleronia aestuarii]|uniref:Autoinducer binding domain-containing protein n=2 Tax=Palleronia aestuarii TaxID=568105 RepID=A0A2W7MVX0_9RHOB|nr:autoinducer binding domain-containing protein [Palleronia aestuarii]
MNWFADLLDDVIASGGELDPEKVAELRRARERIAEGGSLMTRHDGTERLLYRIDEAMAIDQVASVFGEIPELFGFSDASLVVLNEGRTCLARRVISTLPAAWWQDYHQMRLCEDDPLMKTIVSREHELFLDELVPPPPAPRRYMEAAEAHGIGCNGVIFKIAYPSGLVAAVVLNTTRTPDYARRQYRAYRDDLRLVAQATCDALVHFSQVGAKEVDPLTAEEIGFLRLVALSEDPVKALAVDCRQTSQLIQSRIIQKLGVRSIFQAILVAARYGLLDAAMFHPDEVIPTRPLITGWDMIGEYDANGQIARLSA